MEPKPLTAGTKEELIAHFQAAAKAYDYIIYAKDKEILELRGKVSSLKTKVHELEQLKGVHIPDKIKYENNELKRNLKAIKDQILEYGNSL